LWYFHRPYSASACTQPNNNKGTNMTERIADAKAKRAAPTAGINPR